MTDENELAQRMHAIVKNFRALNPSRKVRRIVIRTARFDPVDARKLNDFWRDRATGPEYEGSYVELQLGESQARCTHCNHTFELAEATSACPRCRNERFTIIHQPPAIEDIVLE